MAKSSKRPLAVLAVSRVRRIGNFIITVREIVLNIGNNSTLFTTPEHRSLRLQVMWTTLKRQIHLLKHA